MIVTVPVNNKGEFANVSIAENRASVEGTCIIHNVNNEHLDTLQQQFAEMKRNEGEAGFYWVIPDWLKLLGGEICSKP